MGVTHAVITIAKILIRREKVIHTSGRATIYSKLKRLLERVSNPKM